MVGKKLKGSTIIETLIASIIIMVVFAGGLFTLAQLDIVKSTGAETRTRMILNSEMEALRLNQRYFNETYDYENLTIVKDVLPTSSEDVLVVQMEGWIDEKRISKISEIIELTK